MIFPVALHPAELISWEHETVFVPRRKSASQCLQKKTTREINSVRIMPVFFFFYVALLGGCWERGASEGPRQSVHVQIPLHWRGKKKKYPALACSHTAHTLTLTHICSQTQTHIIFPAALAPCDFLLVSLWPAQSWQCQEMSLFWSETHTQACAHTRTPPHTCTLDIMTGSGVLLPKPWPKVAPSACHE